MSSAFDEGIDEVADGEELLPEEDAGEAAPAAGKPNRFYLVFAIFIIIMSVIGMISTVRFISGQIESLADQTALKNEIALFIYPVVTVDPPAFASAGEIPESVVIESAIWKIVLTGDTANYESFITRICTFRRWTSSLRRAPFSGARLPSCIRRSEARGTPSAMTGSATPILCRSRRGIRRIRR